MLICPSGNISYNPIFLELHSTAFPAIVIMGSFNRSSGLNTESAYERVSRKALVLVKARQLPLTPHAKKKKKKLPAIYDAFTPVTQIVILLLYSCVAEVETAELLGTRASGVAGHKTFF